MKTFRLWLILIVFYQITNAQITTYREFNSSQIFKSPQAEALEKYIDFPVDYSTGTVNISIPIYTLQVGDFTLPISLDYHTSGIKVDQAATNVGLGWVLKAGGAVSRSVQGTYPDEEQYGMYSSKGEFVSSSDYLNDCGCLDCYPSFLDYDSEPDIFSFNMNGISGKFIFDFSRNIHKIPEQDVQIKEDYDNHEFNGWTITSSDGTKYIFNDQETSYTIFDGVTPKIPTSWLLNQIITPDHETINFYYDNSKYENIVEERWSPERTTLSTAYITSISGGYKVKSCQKNLRLDSIVSPNCVIYFDYSSNCREDMKYQSTYCGKALESIIILNRLNRQKLKIYTLVTSYFEDKTKYSYPETFDITTYSYKRLKLDSLQERDFDSNLISAYKFSYNKNNTCSDCMPPRLSMARDYWGYYNGHDENTHLLPTNKYEGSVTLGNREVVASKKTAFMLDEIKYPTGGVAKFFYETDSAGAAILNLSTMESSYQKIPAGGLRIAKTMYIPNNGGDTIKKIYTYNMGSFSLGAPALYFNGDFGDTHLTTPTCKTTIIATCSESAEDQIFSSPINECGGIESNIVYHNQVTVKETGNGSVIYYYGGIPDLYSAGVDPNWWEGYPGVAICPFFLHNLTKETIKNSSGTIVKTIDYDYKTYYRQILFPTDYKALRVIYGDCYRYFFYPMFTGYSYLKDVTETEYRNSKTITAYKTYDYGKLSFMESQSDDLYVFSDESEPDHHFATTISEKKSNGSWLKTKYKFPLDYSSSDKDAITDSLISNYKINDPIEMTSILYDGTNSNITDAQYLKYKIFGGVLKVNKIYRLATTAPIAESSFSFGNISTSNGIKYFTVDTSLLEPKVTFTYNTSAKLIEERLSDNIPISYLWSYKRTYPIAKIENADYSTVETILGGSTTVDYFARKTSPTDAAIKSFLAPLYTNSQLKTSRITTYTYKPLVGITSQTDPNGMITYYGYDTFGRLITIKDDDGHILKTYDYHYYNQ
jgi:YD repeat-containing protein